MRWTPFATVKSTYAADARRQLALEPDVDAVDARVPVVAVEHADAGEERERAGRRRARREQVRPHRHVGERRERRVAEIALLLDAVGRDRSDLAEHVLPGVVDRRRCRARPTCRPAPTSHAKPAARLKLLPLIGNRAVRGEPRIVQERARTRWSPDRRSPASAGRPSASRSRRVRPRPACHLSWMKSANSSLLMSDAPAASRAMPSGLLLCR